MLIAMLFAAALPLAAGCERTVVELERTLYEPGFRVPRIRYLTTTPIMESQAWANQRFLERVERQLDVRIPKRITFIVLPDQRALYCYATLKLRGTNASSHTVGVASGDSLVASIREYHPHEMVHLAAARLGGVPSAFWREGLAVMLSDEPADAEF